MFLRSPLLALLILTTVAGGAQTTFDSTSYQNSYKLVEIGGDSASYYNGMIEDCVFFIADDGIVGRYCEDSKEMYTTCCWRQRGKKFIFSDSVELEKCRIILWNDTAIILEPLREKGTKLHFVK